jgi:energy-coupling factor transporter ATP-binding protein EcfA2
MEQRRCSVIALAKKLVEQVEQHKLLSEACGCDVEIIELHEAAVRLLVEINVTVTDVDVAENYINQFEEHLRLVSQVFPFLNDACDPDFAGGGNEPLLRKSISANINVIKSAVQQMEFSHGFFKKLGFFQNNVVAIGANGSGKTTLAYDLKRFLPQHGVVISAQKVLLIPTFSGVSNINTTSEKLRSSQNADKTYKSTYSTEGGNNAYQTLVQLGGEFHVLLDNLLADRSVVRNKYCEEMMTATEFHEVPKSNLDRVLEIWNSLLPHRTVSCVDGINIQLCGANEEGYPAHQMSDGEKVLLFLVAQVLQAPSSGFVIVDEPEMYLHKLWDVLESERSDCIFIYLTHDLDFAVSRVDAKKIWIKSFNYPDKWEIEDVPENELPESLLLELLGSRKDILFCEGKSSSLDVKIFNRLFPHLTVCPVDSCFDVINYTKSFNKLPMVVTKALGIIDRDYHDGERLRSLSGERVYSYSMAEIENLLLDEEFLNSFAVQLLSDASVVEVIKSEVLNLLRADIELQSANYVSAKINYYFKNSHVSRGKNMVEVESNFAKFIGEVDISSWYAERKCEIEKIVADKNYKRALQIYNNKGLRVVAQRNFRVSEFIDRAVRFLIRNNDMPSILRRHFPNELMSGVE